MTVPTPDPVVTATDANPQAAASNAADEADKHTPSTDPVAPPVDDAGDPSTADGGLAELKEIVTGLATTVAALTDTVNRRNDPDDNPNGKLPWALRGKRSL